MKKIVVISLVMLLVGSIGHAADELGNRGRMTPIRATEIPTLPETGLDAMCFLFNYNPASPMLFSPGMFWDDEMITAYFDPANCWGYNPPSPYPFLIDSVYIPLYFINSIPSGWYTFGVQISCPDTSDPLCPSPNPDPSSPICIDTFQVYHPGGITLSYVMVPFDCCVNSSFFLSLEFLNSPTPDLYPGLCFDSDAIDNCVQYYNYPYPWVEWHDTFMYYNDLCDWVAVVYGNSNSSCAPELCPGELMPVESIFINGTTYIETFNTCLYDSLYDLEPCTSWPDYAQDMTFRVNFANGGDNNLSVTVSPTNPWSWDVSLAILSDSGNFSQPSCICGEDENGVGVPESCTLEGLPDGQYYIYVSGFYSYCGEYEIDISMSLSQSYSPGPPHSVDDLEIIRFFNNVSLSWSPVTQDTLGYPIDVSYYVVYMSTEDPFFEPTSSDSVATVYPPSTRYIDDNALNDLQRFYNVKVFLED